MLFTVAPPPKAATVAVTPGGTMPGDPFTVSAEVPVTPDPLVTVTRLTSVPWCVPPNVSV